MLVQIRPFIEGLVSTGPSSGWGCQNSAKGSVCRQVWGPRRGLTNHMVSFMNYITVAYVYIKPFILFSDIYVSAGAVYCQSSARVGYESWVTRTGIEPKNTGRIDLNNNGSKPSVKMLFFPYKWHTIVRW